MADDDDAHLPAGPTRQWPEVEWQPTHLRHRSRIPLQIHAMHRLRAVHDEQAWADALHLVVDVLQMVGCHDEEPLVLGSKAFGARRQGRRAFLPGRVDDGTLRASDVRGRLQEHRRLADARFTRQQDEARIDEP